MRYTDIDKMMFVVRDLNILIKEYGLKEIQHALNYIVDYPIQPVEKPYCFKNTMGADFYLTQVEYNRVNELNPRLNKIQAIKMFRDITGCGLKEAKDAIEQYYNIPYNRPPYT